MKEIIPVWLDTYDLEREYGFSRSRQAALRSQGRIPYYKMGSYIRYKRQEIDALIAKHKVA